MSRKGKSNWPFCAAYWNKYFKLCERSGVKDFGTFGGSEHGETAGGCDFLVAVRVDSRSGQCANARLPAAHDCGPNKRRTKAARLLQFVLGCEAGKTVARN